MRYDQETHICLAIVIISFLFCILSGIGYFSTSFDFKYLILWIGWTICTVINIINYYYIKQNDDY